MKESRQSACRGIERSEVRPLVLVADSAREREIRLLRQTAVLYRDDVINLVTREGDIFRHSTILTSTAGPLLDELAQRDGNRRHRP